MAFKLFVSYSTRDLTEVEQLRLQLKDTPIEVFVAEHSIEPSQELAPTIAKAIEDCDLFVLLWSKNAKDSDWVLQEIGRAHTLKKTILPLLLTDGMSLPGFIQGIKYLSVFQDPSGSLVKARALILDAFNKKQASIASQLKVTEEKNSLALLGIGAFLFWAFSK